MQELLEYIYVNRELHHSVFEDICNKYNLTLTEVMILLVLHYEQIDTAKEIAMKFKIAKSHLSTSIRHLEEKEYILGEYIGKDHRTIHLHLCENANEIVKEISDIHQRFFDILVKDFSDEEKQQVSHLLKRMINNANAFLDE